MGSILYLGSIFLAKVMDNALSTTKTILIQRSRWLLAGIAVVISDFIYFWVTKRVVSADSYAAMLVVAPDGYKIDDTKYEFSISEDGKVVSVVMTNQLEETKKEETPKSDTTKTDNPTTTTTPSKNTAASTTTSTDGPKTGDDSRMILWAQFESKILKEF